MRNVICGDQMESRDWTKMKKIFLLALGLVVFLLGFGLWLTDGTEFEQVRDIFLMTVGAGILTATSSWEIWE